MKVGEGTGGDLDRTQSPVPTLMSALSSKTPLLLPSCPSHSCFQVRRRVMASHVSVCLNGINSFTCRVLAKLHIVAYELSLTWPGQLLRDHQLPCSGSALCVG